MSKFEDFIMYLGDVSGPYFDKAFKYIDRFFDRAFRFWDPKRTSKKKSRFRW